MKKPLSAKRPQSENRAICVKQNTPYTAIE